MYTNNSAKDLSNTIDDLLCEDMQIDDVNLDNSDTIQTFTPEDVFASYEKMREKDFIKDKNTDKKDSDDFFCKIKDDRLPDNHECINDNKGIGEKSCKRPLSLYVALEYAFEGNFDDAYHAVIYDQKYSDYDLKIASAFFLRYSSKTRYIINEKATIIVGLPVDDTEFLTKHPIALMLHILEEIDDKKYEYAYSSLELLDYSGWKQISYIWNSFLWNSTMHHPEAALICILSKYVKINDYQDLAKMNKCVSEYYDQFAENSPSDFPKSDANVCNYIKYRIYRGAYLCKIRDQKERYARDAFFSTNEMLQGFCKEVFFYCLFTDSFNRSHFKDDPGNIYCQTNIRRAVELFWNIHVRSIHWNFDFKPAYDF